MRETGQQATTRLKSATPARFLASIQPTHGFSLERIQPMGPALVDFQSIATALPRRTCATVVELASGFSCTATSGPRTKKKVHGSRWRPGASGGIFLFEHSWYALFGPSADIVSVGPASSASEAMTESERATLS